MAEKEYYREDNLVIRRAGADDAEKLLAIYAPYVEKTAITFEYQIPTVEEFTDRIRNTLKSYPYIVAEVDGEIVGYAYAGVFHAREAYQWDVETSIYLQMDVRGYGYGRKLYDTMEKLLVEQNIKNLYACIAYTEEEDEHLSNASQHFHEHLGYSLVGSFKQCGYKFDKWYDMIWMEKIVGEHQVSPQPFIPFNNCI